MIFSRACPFLSKLHGVAGGAVFLDLKESAAFSIDVVNLLITSRSCPASGWAILLPSANCNSWLLNEELITSSALHGLTVNLLEIDLLHRSSNKYYY